MSFQMVTCFLKSVERKNVGKEIFPITKIFFSVIMGILGRTTKNETERGERERQLPHPLHPVPYPDITNGFSHNLMSALFFRMLMV